MSQDQDQDQDQEQELETGFRVQEEQDAQEFEYKEHDEDEIPYVPSIPKNVFDELPNMFLDMDVCDICKHLATCCMTKDTLERTLLCNQCLKTQFHFEIKQSNIPTAGLGLFTTQDIKKGDRLGIYAGPVSQHCQRIILKGVRERDLKGVYDITIQVNRLPAILITGYDPMLTSVFRMMNDAIGPDRRNKRLAYYKYFHNNVYMEGIVAETERPNFFGTFVYALEDIRADSELFFDYGAPYWKKHPKYATIAKKWGPGEKYADIPKPEPARKRGRPVGIKEKQPRKKLEDLKNAYHRRRRMGLPLPRRKDMLKPIEKLSYRQKRRRLGLEKVVPRGQESRRKHKGVPGAKLSAYF